jgi:hypothetical protein
VRLRRAAATAALVALAVVATACGGDSDANSYRGDVRDVQERYFADLERFATDATEKIAVDQPGASRALQQYSAAANKLAEEIESVDAPADQQKLGERVVKAYRDLAASSERLRIALSTSDVQTVDEAREGFNRGQAELVDAVDELNAAR